MDLRGILAAGAFAAALPEIGGYWFRRVRIARGADDGGSIFPDAVEEAVEDMLP